MRTNLVKLRQARRANTRALKTWIAAREAANAALPPGIDFFDFDVEAEACLFFPAGGSDLIRPDDARLAPAVRECATRFDLVHLAETSIRAHRQLDLERFSTFCTVQISLSLVRAQVRAVGRGWEDVEERRHLRSAARTLVRVFNDLDDAFSAWSGPDAESIAAPAS